MSAAFMHIGKGSSVAPLSSLNKVLSSGPKVFKLQVGEWEEMVSIEHLKPLRELSLSSQHSRQLADPSHPHPLGLVLVGPGGSL